MRDIFRETFLGFIRVHLLHHAAQERIFGTEMIEELRHHGYELSPGTLYPILHAMQEAGYLASETEAVAGKVRRYYSITPAGLEVLEALKLKVRELTEEVLGEEAPRPAVAPGPVAAAAGAGTASRRRPRR